MSLGQRWPLHPQPQAHESLSSWVFRLAQAYEMSWEAFFCEALGRDPVEAPVLDRQAPASLVQTLSVRTGAPPERIWSMTLASYVPWIIDTLDDQDSACLSTYATQYRTLIRRQKPWMSQGLYNPKSGRYCLPWLGESDSDELAVCPACLRTDRIPYLRLFWRLVLMESCPRHGCLLAEVAGLDPLTHPRTQVWINSADRDLLTVDRLSLQAVTRGVVRMKGGECMPATVYVRFLRSLIEELFCRRSAAGSDAPTLDKIWKDVGYPPYVWLSRSKPFERLSRYQRRATLRAVGRLLGDLPISLQRWMSLAPQGRLRTQRLPYALDHLSGRSPKDR